MDSSLGSVAVDSVVDLGEAVLLKRRAASLLRQKLALHRENGIVFYRPWSKQHLFHSAGYKRFRFFRAGNRTGKSTSNCAECLSWAMNERPWYKSAFDILGPGGRVVGRHDGGENHPLVRLGIPQRPVKICVVQINWDKVEEIWTGRDGINVGKIWTMAPNGLITKALKNHAGVIDTLVCANGSIIKFETIEAFEHNTQRAESSDWDFLLFDEPAPEDMWTALSRGLVDRGGCASFGLTALKHRWINDMFFPAPGQPNKIPDSRWSITADMRENPYLNDAARDEYISTLTDDERACRVEGLPLELSGLVYKEFDYAKHVLDPGPPKGWTDWVTPPPSCVISYSIDTHPQTPQAALFVATDEAGRHFIYDELYRNGTHEVLASEIRARIDGRKLGVRKCEPAAWIEDQSTEFCLGEWLCQNGVWVERASKAKSFGILSMRRLWSRTAAVFVNPALKRFLWEINRYCYDKENKPIDKDDHIMEAMYRLFINEPQWYPDVSKSEGIDDIEITGADLSPVN